MPATPDTEVKSFADFSDLEKEVLERFPLGECLELWKVPIALIQEQDLNARSQAPDTFNQLAANIGQQGRLESLPFCAAVGGKLELISGHHRTRAARKAELAVVWVLVDVSGMSRDQILAKQLAHNAIQGQDNPDIVRAIFDQIADVDARIEAFVSPDMEALNVEVSLESRGLDITLESKAVTILFLPTQFEVLKQALDLLSGSEDEVWLAQREEYDTLIDVVTKTADHYDIRSTPTLFAKMGEIVLAQLAKEQAFTAAAEASAETD